MRSNILRLMMVFLLFLTGTGSILYIDEVCCETTGEGGNLVLDIDNLYFFH